jgi:formamidopyrimidine-DNA glycosylase
MPELPDVEVYKRYLDATALHKTIAKGQVKDAGILEGVSAPKLCHTLEQRQFEATRRHGKHLLVELDQGPWLTLHFGMTGTSSILKRWIRTPNTIACS